MTSLPRARPACTAAPQPRASGGGGGLGDPPAGSRSLSRGRPGVPLTAAERLGDAASTRDALRAASSAQDSAPVWPETWWWWGVIVLGAVLAVVVLVVTYGRVETLRKARVEREAASGSPPDDSHEADPAALLVAGAIAIGAWVGWQVAYARPLYGGGGIEHAKYLHWIAIGAAILALGAGGRAIGDPRLAWRRASVARLQLILLGVLLAVFFLVPVTSAQVNDVLRAWGDGPLSRVAFGIAAAVLLGAVVRASAQRLLVPTIWSAKRWQAINRVALGVGILLVFLFLLAGAQLGAVAVAVVIAVAALTSTWIDPECAEPDSEEELGSSASLARSACSLSGFSRRSRRGALGHAAAPLRSQQ